MKSFGAAGMSANASAPKKKMVIVPFKNKPKLPDNFEQIRLAFSCREKCKHN